MTKKSNTFFRRLCMALPYCLFTMMPLALSAQSFTQRIQTENAGGGRITIHQDAAIDDLVNGKITPPAQPRQENNAPRRQTQANGSQQPRNNENTETRNEQRQVHEQEPDSVNINQPLRTRKVTGYRIQVFNGGNTRANQQKAEQTGSALRSMFPGHRVYVKFYSPRWTCRLGNFRTLDEAREVYNEVVRMGYDRATIVRGTIDVPY